MDDVALLRRGVRPGVPALYKNAFADDDIPPLITLNARSTEEPPAVYDVSLDNPVRAHRAEWRFASETVALGEGAGAKKYVTRSPRGATLWGEKGEEHPFKPSRIRSALRRGRPEPSRQGAALSTRAALTAPGLRHLRPADARPLRGISVGERAALPGWG